MSLEADLKEIRGIGDAKAEEIMAVVGEAGGVNRELVERAYETLQDGRTDLCEDALKRALED